MSVIKVSCRTPIGFPFDVRHLPLHFCIGQVANTEPNYDELAQLRRAVASLACLKPHEYVKIHAAILYDYKIANCNKCLAGGHAKS